MNLSATVKAAQRADFVGWDGQQLVIRVTAIPQSGQSNRHIEALLAQTFNLPKTMVTIVKGHTSHYKTIMIEGDTVKIQAELESLPKVNHQQELFS